LGDDTLNVGEANSSSPEGLNPSSKAREGCVRTADCPLGTSERAEFEVPYRVSAIRGDGTPLW
jgi:hypothetical protein